MNATALSAFSMQPADLPRPHLSRNAAIALGVVALHVGLIWALQSGLLLRTAQLIVPVEVLAQLIELPEPRPEPAPPAPPAPPVRPVTPSVQKKVVPKPATRPQAQPLAIADPTPSPNAPTGSLAPDLPATPAVAAAPPAAPAPPAPPVVQLPSSDADYLQNPKPAYPRLSMSLGEQGTAVIHVLVGVDGVAQKAEIQKSSGFSRLDQTALNTALHKWRYTPGKRDGVAVELWVNVPITFKLLY